MNKVDVAFYALGYLTRMLIASLLLEAFIRPLAHRIIGDAKQSPRVLHYVERHVGRSFNCPACRESAS